MPWACCWCTKVTIGDEWFCGRLLGENWRMASLALTLKSRIDIQENMWPQFDNENLLFSIRISSFSVLWDSLMLWKCNREQNWDPFSIKKPCEERVFRNVQINLEMSWSRALSGMGSRTDTLLTARFWGACADQGKNQLVWKVWFMRVYRCDNLIWIGRVTVAVGGFRRLRSASVTFEDDLGWETVIGHNEKCLEL